MQFYRKLKPVFFAQVAFVVMLAACQSAPGPKEPESPVIKSTSREQARWQQCEGLLKYMDETVDRQGVRDAQAQRIRGFPYLRINRFLASYAGTKLQANRFNSWLDLLQALDLEARRMEWRNLGAARSELTARYPVINTGSFENTVSMCSTLLRARDFSANSARSDLYANLEVRPEYNSWQRILGLYPITAIFVRMGIDRLHHHINEIFRTAEARIPVKGRLLQYVPEAPEGFPNAHTARAQPEMPMLMQNSLGMPVPTARQQELMFRKFAPVILVDTVTPDDRIGEPVLTKEDARVRVNTGAPVLYKYLSYTRFHGQVLLQINYVFWFPARSRQSGIDISAGHLDGITWRVTLSGEGKPLMYDAMHNCGCYHQFFPTGQLRLRAQAREVVEPVLVPQIISGSKIPVIRLRSADHYIVRVDSMAQADRTVQYTMKDYNILRTLPVVGTEDTRSLFGPDGIIAGTQRLERFLLWPMGVPDPGEMRQVGHHAIAFIGQRHFDDPDLMERFFDYAF